MGSAIPSVGQTVVVQFGPADASLTRCSARQVDDPDIELEPFDPLSGRGVPGSRAALTFSHGGRPTRLAAYLAEAATPSRVVVRPERRHQARTSCDHESEIVVAGESSTIHARLVDLSLGGLRVTVAEPLPVGLMTSVRITSATGDPTRFIAEVVSGAEAGTGLRFVSLNDYTLSRLRSLLE